jgi:ElaB/YqjD/DUF883 family membrane-anchored ribosome-binding protein
MAQEPAVIRRQMQATRMALTDKIELLEREVVDTVRDTSSAVTNTVTVAKDGVQEVVQMVKDSVQGTVEAVQETFDLPRQVALRPWSMVGGATALGFLGGYLLQGTRSRQPQQARMRASEAVVVPEARPTVLESITGTAQTNGKSTAAAAPIRETSVVENLGKKFEKEISQLKGLAVGTLFGILRDVVMPSIPKPLEQQVEEVIDGFTEKLGGKPIHGHVLPVRAEVESVGEYEHGEFACGEPNSSRHFHSTRR